MIELDKKRGMQTEAVSESAAWFFIPGGPTAQTHAHADLWTLHMCNKTSGSQERSPVVCHTNRADSGENTTSISVSLSHLLKRNADGRLRTLTSQTNSLHMYICVYIFS